MTTQPSLRPWKMLLAVDGSENALAAIHFLRALPLGMMSRPGSLVHVAAVLDARHTASRATLLSILDKTYTLLLEQGIEAKTGLLHGSPAQELTNYAKDHQLDLIILGAIGLRATLGILLGGVAQQVVEYATCPVLVVRGPYRELKRVLVATDGSPNSEHALEYLAHFPFPADVDVRVAHVLPPEYQPEMLARSWAIYPDVVVSIPDRDLQEAADWHAAQEKEAQAVLTQAVKHLAYRGLSARAVTLQGDAATELIKYLKSESIDLFVVGSRGLSPVQSWLLGSVSRKLIHYAGCSGLIVKQTP